MDLSHLQFVHSNISAKLRQTLNSSAPAKGISDCDQLLVDKFYSYRLQVVTEQ